MRGADFEEALLGGGVEDVNFADTQCEQEGADEIGGEDDRPETQQAKQSLAIFVEEKRQDDRERVFGEELLAAEYDDEKADAISEAADERAPRRVGEMGHERAFGDEREAHGESGGERGPGEGGGGAAKFVFAFTADGFVDDVGADGLALFDLLRFGAGDDRGVFGGVDEGGGFRGHARG